MAALGEGAFPAAMVAGPDGALWFTEIHGNQIGRITTSGQITEYAIPTADNEDTIGRIDYGF
jgi:virginiamycin B lyase